MALNGEVVVINEAIILSSRIVKNKATTPFKHFSICKMSGWIEAIKRLEIEPLSRIKAAGMSFPTFTINKSPPFTPVTKEANVT